MMKLVKLFSAMAVLASLPGSEAVAQHKLVGDAANKSAPQLQPRFVNGNLEGAGAALGNQLMDLGNEDQVQEPRTRRRIEPDVGGGHLPDLVPGTPFVVFVGPSASNPVLLIDAGIVPEDGIRAVELLPALAGPGNERFRDMSTYFQSGDIVVCLTGRDDQQSYDDVALVGPGMVGLQSGKGATLVASGHQSLTMSGQAAGSDDRGSDADGGQGRRRHHDDTNGTSVSVGQQAAP